MSRGWLGRFAAGRSKGFKRHPDLADELIVQQFLEG